LLVANINVGSGAAPLTAEARMSHMSTLEPN